MFRKLFISSFILLLLVGIALGVYFLRPSKRYAQHFKRGLLYFEKNKHAEAIIEFNAANKVYPKKKTLLMYLAESYQRNNQNEESISVLNKLISEFPKDQKIYTVLMKNYVANKQYLEALAICNDYLQIDEGNAETINQKGLVLAFLKQTGQAKIEFLKAIKLASDKPDAYSNLAKVYWQEKDVDNAIAILKKFLQIKPDQLYIRNQLGDYYQFSNQLDEAIEQFTYLYEKNPKRIFQTATKLSLVLLLSKNMDKLEKVVDSVFSKKPSKLEISPLLFYARGALLLRKKQYKEAIADFEFARQRKLELSNLRYLLAWSYDKVGKTILAIKELENLALQKPSYIPAHQLLVKLLIEENQVQQAINHCDKYLDKIPESTKLRELKALVIITRDKMQETQYLYEELSLLENSLNIDKRRAILEGNSKEVIEKLHLLLGENQANPHSLYLLLGRKYLLIQNYEKAREYAHLASEAETVRLSAWKLLAHIYTSSQEPQKAIEQYEKILKEEPYHKRVPFELADLYYQMRQNQKALGILQKYNKMESTKPIYLELLANISYRDKKYDEATKYLEKIKPQTSTQKKLLGDIYRLLGKQKEAIKAYGEEGNDSEIIIRQGFALFLDKKWPQAADKLAKFVHLKPEKLLVGMLYCVALVENNNLEKALEHSDKMLNKTKTHQGLVRFTRSMIYLKKGDFTKAQNELAQIPPSDKATREGVKELIQFAKKQQMNVTPVLTVLLVTEMGDSHTAAKLHKKLSRLLKRTQFVRYLQAILMERTRKSDEFRTIVDSLASEPDRPSYINAFVGRSLNHQGRFDEAEKFLVMALPMHKENATMIMELANNYSVRRKNEQALATFQMIINLAETEENRKRIAHACNNAAWLMAKSSPPKLRQALEYAIRANKIIPNFAPFLDTLGSIYFKGKKWNKAEKHFAKALQISPQKISYKFRLAEAYLKLDKKEQAKKLLREVLANKESEKKKKEAQELLNNLP